MTHYLGGINVATEFHVFGMEWFNGSIKYYIDDTELHSVAATSCSNDPHHVILSLETVEAAGLPDTQALGQTGPVAFEVDYVRVWEYQAAPTAAPTVRFTTCVALTSR